LFFITGSDAIAQILSWHEAAKLWDLAHFVAVSRPGHKMEIPEVPAGAVTFVEVPALSISSTDCRNRVANGDPIWYLVPDGVVQYIGKHGLYRGIA
jgi:nicotinate-nucleotide adenylyltransferase